MSLKIEFVTPDKYKGCIAEPIPAAKAFPEWFQKLEYLNLKRCPFKTYMTPPEDEGERPHLSPSISTGLISHCPGITDFMKFGYIVPAWNTFIFSHDSTTNQLRCDWIDEYKKSGFRYHESSQFYTMLEEQRPKYNAFFKIEGPWYVRTQPGVSILITHPVWHRNKIVTTATGVYHSDISACQLHWFMELNKEVDVIPGYEDVDYEKQVISEGTPIIQIIPFYRKNFKSKITYINGTKFDAMCEQTKSTNQFSRFFKNAGITLYNKARRGMDHRFK